MQELRLADSPMLVAHLRHLQRHPTAHPLGRAIARALGREIGAKMNPKEEEFLAEYTSRLAAAVAANPSEYGYPPEEAPEVAARMIPALKRGSANKEGRAIRGTCRALGIPYTYAGIRAYLADA